MTFQFRTKSRKQNVLKTLKFAYIGNPTYMYIYFKGAQ